MGRKQPTKIDADEYEKFVQFVQDVHGGTRGHLRTEIENALREYRESYYNDANDRLQRIEDDVATVKALLAEADADGGTTIPDSATPPGQDGSTHTQTQTDVEDEQPHDSDNPPHPKATKKAKLDWLEAEVRERSADQKFSVPAVRRVIEKTWGFEERTADPLVEALIDDRLEAWVDSDGTIEWGDA